MDPTKPGTPIDEDVETLLRRLEHVLAEEHAALSKLDIQAVEQAARDKSELGERLRRVDRSGNPVSAARLERVRRRLLRNQVLLVHARDTTRGLIQLHTGGPTPSYGPGGVVRLSGHARLSTKG
ncbi:MAG: hypothetical protein U0263_09930 [Polyangiaceae bacterium]